MAAEGAAKAGEAKAAADATPDATLSDQVAVDAEARYDQLRLAIRAQVDEVVGLVKGAVTGGATEQGDDEHEYE